jgi:hypothetical protein
MGIIFAAGFDRAASKGEYVSNPPPSELSASADFCRFAKAGI